MLLVAVLHAWFAPGLIAGEDFLAPPFLTQTTILHSGFWPPSIEPLRDFGQNMQPWWPSFPVWAVTGALLRAGIPWTVLERLFWLWPYCALAIIAPYWFLRRRAVSPAAASVATALFALNTWTVGSIERGHIPALIAYALMPFVLDRFLVVVRERRAFAATTLALLIAVQAVYEVRYAYLTILACAVVYGALVARRRRRYATRAIALRVAVAAGLALLLTLYWWLSLILSPLSAAVDTAFSSFLKLSGKLSIGHALALFYPYYHHNLVVPAFAAEPVELPFFLLPALAVAGFYVARRRDLAVAFAALWVADVVVLSGPKSPLGFVSAFLYLHLPGFDLFRGVEKLYSIAVFGASFGVALALDRATAFARLRHLRLQPVVAVAGVIFVALLMRDAFDPTRQSNFAATRLRPQDVALQRFIDTASGDGTVALFPSYFPGVDPSVRHPIVSAGQMALATPPLGMTELLYHHRDTIPKLLYRFVRSEEIHRVLASIGVQYVALVDDPEDALNRPWLYDLDRATSQRLLGSVPWLRRSATFGSDALYLVRGARPRSVAAYPALADPKAFVQLNASEAVGPAFAGRLLEQNQAFDPSWHLALLPPGARPSGDPLADYLRFREGFVPASEHVRIVGEFNGWRLGKNGTGLLLFVPTAVSELGALAELPALAIFALGAWWLRP